MNYCQKIGYGKTALEYLKENKQFVTYKNGHEQISTAAVLLFGKNPQIFFPRTTIRFIKYEGLEAKVGKEMNVVKDVIFWGRILELVEKATDFIKLQMRESTHLVPGGIFVTEDEYSEFVRTEIVGYYKIDRIADSKIDLIPLLQNHPFLQFSNWRLAA
ncbi:MAG: hypothetical protein IJ228_02730 [Succinivibrio sp.]|nr:hypothetical protein [Succinivibrio sp.]